MKTMEKRQATDTDIFKEPESSESSFSIKNRTEAFVFEGASCRQRLLPNAERLLYLTWASSLRPALPLPGWQSVLWVRRPLD